MSPNFSGSAPPPPPPIDDLNYPYYQGTVGYVFDATGQTNMFPIWLRLRLTGTNLYFYTGADGTNWYLCGRVSGLPSDWPATAYVGLATTSATNSLYTRAQFSQYGNYVAPARRQVLIVCGDDANGGGHQYGMTAGGSFGFPSALSTPAGNPNAPPLWDTSTVWFYNLLLDLGYSITVVHPDTVMTEDGVDKSLIVVCGSVNSGQAVANGLWVALPVPEINWKYATKEKEYWLSSGQRGHYVGSSIQIVNNNNPITGTNNEFAVGQIVEVADPGTFFCYADTNNLWHGGLGFTTVAVDPDNPGNGLLYYADVGASYYDSAIGAIPVFNTYASTMPARRLGLWMGDDGLGPVGDWNQTTPLGLQLLTNSINWAVAITTNAPTVTGPASQAVNAGQMATFSVAVAGPGPYRFQWLKNNAPVGGSYADYTTPPTAPSDNASTFQVVVTGLFGSVTSSLPATLTVQGSLPVSNISATLSGNHLSLSWSGGTGILLASPNVALPMTSWVPVATNPPMPYIITTSPGTPQMFYRAK